MADTGALDGAKLIAAGLTVITTVTGLVGAFTGGIPRLLRNNPDRFHDTMVLVLLAIVFTFVASALAQPNLTTTMETKDAAGSIYTETRTGTTSKRRARVARVVLSGIGLALFGLAALNLARGLSESTGTADQPRLSASWTFPAGQRPMLTVKMQLDNLTAKQTVYVNVTPLGSPISQSIYRSQTGADADGVADATFDVVLPPGKTGLQIVAAVDHPTTCQGARIAEVVPPTAANAASINASVTSKPSPTVQPTSTGVSPPVKSDGLAFSCIQVAAPPLPSSTPPSSTTPRWKR